LQHLDLYLLHACNAYRLDNRDENKALEPFVARIDRVVAELMDLVAKNKRIPN